jgi:hypothetical protein
VQILEHEQHRCGGGPLGEQRQHLLERQSLRASHPPLLDRPRLPERTQRLDERLIRQFRADEVDRATEEDVEPRVAGSCSKLGREARLADARFSSEEDGCAAPRPRRVERAVEFPQFADASDEHVV